MGEYATSIDAHYDPEEEKTYLIVRIRGGAPGSFYEAYVNDTYKIDLEKLEELGIAKKIW